MIPKIIHQIWLSELISTKHLEWIETVKINNPNHTHILWDAKKCKCFTKIIDKCGLNNSHPSFKSDLIRLLILYNYGGIYLDCDVECFGPIPDKKIEGCINRNPKLVDSCILASTANNLFIKKVLQFGVKQSNSIDVPHRFGYYAFTKLIENWDNVIKPEDANLKHYSLFSWKGQK